MIAVKPAQVGIGGKAVRGLVTLALSLSLAGCISFQSDPPESLLTLTSSAEAPAGSGAVAGAEGSKGAIAVLTPEVPAKIDVLRVPVNVSDTEIAYLPEAVWVEKPARLFRRLLGESLRTASGAESGVLILDTDDTPTLATEYVRGTLLDLTYDAPTSSVIVRFDAIHTKADGSLTSRRFEATESGVLAEAGAVGAALNRVSNSVATEVAAWVMSAG